MTIINAEEIALALAKAEKEKEVIGILKREGYWDVDDAWCEYGNDPMNYSIIGNQQSSADNALVEKLVNSVDAVLMRECLKQGIDPSSQNAPQNIAEAQKNFFKIYNGKLSSLDNKQRASLGKKIFLVATGSKTKPSFSVIDRGEGQSPKRMPETILSLTKSNKIKIPFVQGKFGMGGSGVLRFCSPANSVVLVISKRNHEINNKVDEKIFGNDETRDMWGFTIIRREDPKSGERSSRYTYLAPNGKIPSFNASTLPLLPGPHPSIFDKPLISGTFIKLYEYEIGSSLKSFVVFDLYYRLALLMPDVALPIKMTERRGYKGHTHETTLAGLNVRLDEDKSKNLEPEFQTPSTGKLTVDGEKFDYLIYVFKKAKKENYARSEGVIFSINGQTHGSLRKDFFNRKAVGMSYLSESILVIIDCSKVSRRKQEELFMPSRDRLANTDIRHAIEKELQHVIKKHGGLKDLQNRRRKEAIENKLQDAKPLADVLEKIIKNSSTLPDFFLHGGRIRNPFDMKKVGSQKDFKGKEFPTYFNPVKEFTKDKPKLCPINRRFRIQYETDANNDYFGRDKEPGNLILEVNGQYMQNYTLNLWNGIANLTISIPENVKIGDVLHLKTTVDDVSKINPFINEFFVSIGEKSNANQPGGKRERKDPASDDEGEDRQKESFLDVPTLVEIRKEDWNEDTYKDFNFNKYSALKVKKAEGDGVYDFFINMDNIYLTTEIKSNTKIDTKILEARYRYGMVLLGMSILHFEENRHNHKKEDHSNDSDESNVSVYDQVSQFTEAVSPTLLPMIASLGDSELEA